LLDCAQVEGFRWKFVGIRTNVDRTVRLCDGSKRQNMRLMTTSARAHPHVDPPQHNAASNAAHGCELAPATKNISMKFVSGTSLRKLYGKLMAADVNSSANRENARPLIDPFLIIFWT
jgi:hypothetical protein